jgi:uncharacterized protein
MKTAIITGATGGIGYEFAKLLASQSYNLVLTGRNPDILYDVSNELNKLFNIKIDYLVSDLSSMDGLNRISNYLTENSIKIDVMINNAGFGIWGLFSDTEFKTESEMIFVNCTALTFLTKIAVKHMIKRGKGRILNVASTAAFKPGPLMSVYYATKAYVLSFSMALASELKGTGVKITVLCPGPVKTEFFKKSSPENRNKNRFRKLSSPKSVAKYGFDAMIKGKQIAIPGLYNKILYIAVKVFPIRIITEVLYKLKNSKCN